MRSTVHLAKYVVRDMVAREDDPADVARAGFEAMMAGKERVVAASLTAKLQGRGSRFMPDSLKAEMHRKMAEPGSATPD